MFFSYARAKQRSPRPEEFGRGAVAGVLVCGFYLIRALGVHGAVYVAVAGNLMLGLVAWFASGRVRPTAPPEAHAAGPAQPARPSDAALPRATWTLLLLALFLSGLTSFAYEI